MICRNEQRANEGAVIVQDVFGNYVVQRILERREDDEVGLLLTIMCGHIQELSLNMYGCRVVQTILEVCFCARTMLESTAFPYEFPAMTGLFGIWPTMQTCTAWEAGSGLGR